MGLNGEGAGCRVHALRSGADPGAGPIAHPDVIVVAEASLLDDAGAHVLEGMTEQTVLFVNSSLSTEAVRPSVLPTQVSTRDVTGMALEQLGSVRRSVRCSAPWQPSL